MTTPTPTTRPEPAAAPIRRPTALIVSGPALLALVGVVTPIDDTDEPAERLADIYANPGRYGLTLVLLVAALMLLVPAVLAVRNVAPPGARRNATIGAVLAAAGFMLFTVASGALGFAPSAWTSLPDAQRQELLPAFAAMDEGKGALGPVLAAPLLPLLGLGILAAVLWHHTALRRVALAALPLGWAVFLFAPTNPLRSLGALVLLMALLVATRTSRT